jgi:hypothetical protein
MNSPRDTAERLTENNVTSLLMSKVDLYNERDGGLIEGMVPAELIRYDDVPVEENHVRELADSMAGEMSKGTIGGQLSPVLLGEVPGSDKFYIIDGFHRAAANVLLGNDRMFCTIRPNTSEEEILDLRILTANTHTSVSFARIYEWVSDAWGKSPWSDKINASQAFSLAGNAKVAVKSGRNLGLTPEEATEIREWAADKCEKWHVSIGNVYTVMSTAQVADPDLVKRARPRRSGHELPTLTPQHLSVIAKANPYNYAKQRLLADVATSQNLTVDEVKKVVDHLGEIIDIEDVQLTIEHTDWKNLLKKPDRKKKAPPTTSSENFILPETRGFRRELLLSEIRIAKLAIENSVLRGDYLAAPLHDSRQGLFSVNFRANTALKEAVLPTSDADTTDKFTERLDQVQSIYKNFLLKQGRLTEDQIDHAIRAAGQRISQDIEVGALRFVEFSRSQAFDELIKACITDEVRKINHSPVATSLAETSAQRTEFSLDSSMSVFSKLRDNAKTSLALVGFMNISSFSVAQTLGAEPQQMNQLVAVIEKQLVTSERLYAKSS